MEKILKEHEIEIVISAVGGEQVKDQLPLIDAIKAVGTIKVYLYIYTVLNLLNGIFEQNSWLLSSLSLCVAEIFAVRVWSRRGQG